MIISVTNIDELLSTVFREHKECTSIKIIIVKTCILTKKMKLKKQRKYLAHCDTQVIFDDYFLTTPVTN